MTSTGIYSTDCTLLLYIYVRKEQYFYIFVISHKQCISISLENVTKFYLLRFVFYSGTGVFSTDIFIYSRTRKLSVFFRCAAFLRPKRQDTCVAESVNYPISMFHSLFRISWPCDLRFRLEGIYRDCVRLVSLHSYSHRQLPFSSYNELFQFFSRQNYSAHCRNVLCYPWMF